MANTRNYGTSGATTTAATKTMLTVISAATVRPLIYDVVVSSAATPADNAAQYQFKRCTTAGTVTAFTPIALDNGDPASLSSSGFNASAEPTYTASSQMMDFATNQRATFRWVAAPGGELRSPATAANGIGLQCIAIGGSGVSTLVTFHFAE